MCTGMYGPFISFVDVTSNAIMRLAFLVLTEMSQQLLVGLPEKWRGQRLRINGLSNA